MMFLFSRIISTLGWKNAFLYVKSCSTSALISLGFRLCLIYVHHMVYYKVLAYVRSKYVASIGMAI